MPRMALNKAHFTTLLILISVFAVFDLVVVTKNGSLTVALLTAAGTVLGPMTGAISRGFQSCCVRFSLHLMPYFLPFIGLAVLPQVQWSATPTERALNGGVRLGFWILGWFGWFFGGVISFGHALG
jgi:hypothetical protein